MAALVVIGVAALLIVGVIALARRRATTGAAAAPVPATVALYLLQGQATPPYLPLAKGVLTIGRDPRSDLVLLDPSASRQHAQVILSAYGYLLRDMGSANGTLVNGVPIREHILQPGDRIQLGNTVLSFWYTQGTGAGL